MRSSFFDAEISGGRRKAMMEVLDKMKRSQNNGFIWDSVEMYKTQADSKDG